MRSSSSSFFRKAGIKRSILEPVVLLRIIGVGGLVGPEGFYREIFGWEFIVVIWFSRYLIFYRAATIL